MIAISSIRSVQDKTVCQPDKSAIQPRDMVEGGLFGQLRFEVDKYSLAKVACQKLNPLPEVGFWMSLKLLHPGYVELSHQQVWYAVWT